MIGCRDSIFRAGIIEALSCGYRRSGCDEIQYGRVEDRFRSRCRERRVLHAIEELCLDFSCNPDVCEFEPPLDSGAVSEYELSIIGARE